MTEPLLLLAALATACLGCALLALSQSRHWRLVNGGQVSPSATGTAAMRGLAVVMIVAALGFAFGRDGAAFGALLWSTLVSLAAAVTALTLAWSPHWLRPIAWPFRSHSRSPMPGIRGRTR